MSGLILCNTFSFGWSYKQACEHHDRERFDPRVTGLSQRVQCQKDTRKQVKSHTVLHRTTLHCSYKIIPRSQIFLLMIGHSFLQKYIFKSVLVNEKKHKLQYYLGVEDSIIMIKSRCSHREKIWK